MPDVLILCTGNSCRSQMAEGFLKSLDRNLSVVSAGTRPAARVHPLAVKVMAEAGIDISRGKPKPVDRFLNDAFDYVITVCDDANDSCPVFAGNVTHRLHLPFDDPALARGSDVEIISEFRRIRDEIQSAFRSLYKSRISSS